MSHPRPPTRRLLCLHGAAQSSASFRALLAPLSQRLPSNWAMHFLEAPLLLPPSPAGEGGGEGSSAPAAAAEAEASWEQAAALADVLSYLSPTHAAYEHLKERYEALSEEMRAELEKAADADEREALVGRKQGRSCERGWVVRLDRAISEDKNGEGGQQGEGQEQWVGLEKSLENVGAYLREYGPFHGYIASTSGYSLVQLLQSLLLYPRSSAPHYPSFFPRLPPRTARPPRMGGWEVEPLPLPLDGREIGAKETLEPNYAATQGPLRYGVVRGREGELGGKEREWIRGHEGEERRLSWPQDEFGVEWSEHVAAWLQCAADASDGDAEAAARLEAMVPPSSGSSGSGGGGGGKARL